MKTIKILKPCYVQGKACKPGEVMEVERSVANILIGVKQAEATTDSVKPKEKAKPKSKAKRKADTSIDKSSLVTRDED